MTLVMRDSVTPADIPISGTQIAAGYGTGPFSNMTALRARFPSIPCISVDTNGTDPTCNVRDWETGDEEGNLEQWVIDHNNSSGQSDAVVYCNRSTIGSVRQLTGSQILNQDYFLWIATLDGTIYGPSDLAGVIACQYETVNNDYDQSEVWEESQVWWTIPGGPPVTDWRFLPVQNLTLSPGTTSFAVTFDAPAGFVGTPPSPAPGVLAYEIAAWPGGQPSGPTVASYPRYIPKGSNPESYQGGSLQSQKGYTVGVRAVYSETSGDHASDWSAITFNTTS